MDTLYSQLRSYGAVKANAPLANYTTFKIGGPAKFLVTVDDNAKLVELLNFLSEQGEDFYILGGGSNLLLPDEGLDKIVIRIQSRKTTVDNQTIEAEAGAALGVVVNLAVQNGLTGLEWAAGIPGTVGGAIRGNAGAMGRATNNCLQTVEIWRAGEVEKMTTAECIFGYRTSGFKRDQAVILRAWFQLQFGDQQKILAQMQDYIKLRASRHPTAPSAGSFFKNLELTPALRAKFKDLPEQFIQRHTIPAGWLIDQTGMRGYTVGGAKVTEEHSNFIVNFNRATQSDILAVVEEAKKRVYNTFGIELDPEVEVVR